MKKWILFFLATVILMWASASLAQWGENLIGLASDLEDNEHCLYGPGMQVYTVSLYLDYPVNPDFGPDGVERWVQFVSGFECRVWIEEGAEIIGSNFPVDAINIGTGGNLVVGFAEPVMVFDGRAILATLDIFLEYPGGSQTVAKASHLECDYPTAFAHMAPIMPYPSIEGMLAYLDAEDPDEPLVGAWADLALPEDIVMVMEATPVAVERQSWGGIKALYR